MKDNVAITIGRLNAKLLRLASNYMRGVLMNTVDNDRVQGEDVTIYEYIRSRKRQKTRLVLHILDSNG